MRGLRIGAATVALLVGLGRSINAQEEFPGGWDAELGYQTFVTVTVQGASSGFGTTNQGFGGYGVSPFGARSAASGFTPVQDVNLTPGARRLIGPASPAPQQRAVVGATAGGSVVNAIRPLEHSIRHATRRRGRTR